MVWLINKNVRNVQSVNVYPGDTFIGTVLQFLTSSLMENNCLDDNVKQCSRYDGSHTLSASKCQVFIKILTKQQRPMNHVLIDSPTAGHRSGYRVCIILQGCNTYILYMQSICINL